MHNVLYNCDSYKKYGYLYLLIFPLMTLYLSLRDFRQPQARNFFMFFCAFLGMIHIYDPEGGTTADGADYAKALFRLNNSELSWENYSSTFFQEGERTIDVYQPTLTFIVAQFTNNAHILFFLFALIFGFFYSRNVWYLLDRIEGRLSPPLIILIAFYILICPVWTINGARMWTGLHVFIYAAMPYVFEKDKSRLIWILIAPLVHFSYALPLMIFLLYVLLPININILFVLYLITLSISSLDMEFVRTQLNMLPSYMLPRVEAYVDERKVETIQTLQYTKAFHFVAAMWVSANFAKFGMIYLYFKAKELIYLNVSFKRMYAAALLFYTFSNITSLIPSGGRFIYMSQFFFYFTFVFYLNRTSTLYNNPLLKWPIYFLILPIILFLRMGVDFYGISILVGNPVTVWLFTDNRPIIQFIKEIF